MKKSEKSVLLVQIQISEKELNQQQTTHYKVNIRQQSHITIIK